MYLLEPVIHETVWGGNRLKKYWSYGGKIGHLYLVSGHSDLTNIIMNGNLAGMTLEEAFKRNKSSWKLSDYEEFPLTVALVDATDDLSIQVHPDDIVAKEIEGERIGKTESWIFLNAPRSGWIYGGCNCSSVEEIKYAVESNRLSEVTAHFPVHEMDCVTVNAGTLHSMTAGSLVYEIEYGSNYTYRFYDFDRIDNTGNKRELHISKAIKAVKPDMLPQKQIVKQLEPLDEGPYQIQYLENVNEYINNSNEIEILTILSGEGKVDSMPFSGGMSILTFPGEVLANVSINKMIVARLLR